MLLEHEQALARLQRDLMTANDAASILQLELSSIHNLDNDTTSVDQFKKNEAVKTKEELLQTLIDARKAKENVSSSKQKERASRIWKHCSKQVFITPPSFKLILLSSPRSPLF